MGGRRWQVGVVAVVVAAAIASLSAASPARAVAQGRLTVLVAAITWGPTPFAVETARQKVFDDMDAFYRASSGGRLSFDGRVVGWTRIEGPPEAFCSPRALSPAFRAATGIDPGSFDRVIWLTPRIPCNVLPNLDGPHVFLYDWLLTLISVHEMAHTFGLGEGHAWLCDGSACRVEPYGNPFSLMGTGAGEFNAYEKNALGWLSVIVRPTRAGEYEIAPIEGPSTRPQALHVTTASADYWFESRSLVTPKFYGVGVPEQPGVAVVAGPPTPADEVPTPFPRENLLLPNPAGPGHRAYRPGETFRVADVFEVEVVRNDGLGALLRFRWLDRTPPGTTRIFDVLRNGRRVALAWNAATDGGSGVGSYDVTVDGRIVRRVGATPGDAGRTSVRLTRGTHVLRVAAVDRAGNRGRYAAVRIRVPK